MRRENSDSKTAEKASVEDDFMIPTEVNQVMEDILDTLECDGGRHLVLSKGLSSVRLVPQKRKDSISENSTTTSRGKSQTMKRARWVPNDQTNGNSVSTNFISNNKSSNFKRYAFLGDTSAGSSGVMPTLTSAASQLITPTLMSQQKDTTWTKLFVGGLPYHTTDKTLCDHFKVYGDLDEAVVITDRQTGKSRGYGFVIF